MIPTSKQIILTNLVKLFFENEHAMKCQGMLHEAKMYSLKAEVVRSAKTEDAADLIIAWNNADKEHTRNKLWKHNISRPVFPYGILQK